MRAVLLDWLIEVHHQFKLLQVKCRQFYITISSNSRQVSAVLLDWLNEMHDQFKLLQVNCNSTLIGFDWLIEVHHQLKLQQES